MPSTRVFADFRPDCVVHLAAQAGVRYSLSNPRAYVSSNLDGFLAVLEACRAQPVRHLVYASSSSVYGANSKLPYHEDDPVVAPVSLYAATKRANELMAQTYAHLYGIACSGVRFFTVYGPWGRPDMAYYSFTKAILEGHPIDVFNHGRMQRDFTYIDDVIEALIRLVDVPPGQDARDINPTRAPHIIYNIGNHTPIELERFIAALESALGREAQKRYLPMQPGDVLATYADVEPPLPRYRLRAPHKHRGWHRPLRRMVPVVSRPAAAREGAVDAELDNTDDMRKLGRLVAGRVQYRTLIAWWPERVTTRGLQSYTSRRRS